jgi:hypothetical protein
VVQVVVQANPELRTQGLILNSIIILHYTYNKVYHMSVFAGSSTQLVVCSIYSTTPGGIAVGTADPPVTAVFIHEHI